jgi:hypothetical protein
MHYQRDDEHEQQNKKSDLGNSGSRERDKPKSQRPCYQRNNQENQGVIEHF